MAIWRVERTVGGAHQTVRNPTWPLEGRNASLNPLPKSKKTSIEGKKTAQSQAIFSLRTARRTAALNGYSSGFDYWL